MICTQLFTGVCIILTLRLILPGECEWLTASTVADVSFSPQLFLSTLFVASGLIPFTHFIHSTLLSFVIAVLQPLIIRRVSFLLALHLTPEDQALFKRRRAASLNENYTSSETAFLPTSVGGNPIHSRCHLLTSHMVQLSQTGSSEERTFTLGKKVVIVTLRTFVL